jgi:hypothetical protein
MLHLGLPLIVVQWQRVVELIGQCFVHGIMYEENLTELSPEMHIFF